MFSGLDKQGWEVFKSRAALSTLVGELFLRAYLKIFYLPLFLWFTASETCIIGYHPFDGMYSVPVSLPHPCFFLSPSHIFVCCIKPFPSLIFKCKFLSIEETCYQIGCLTLVLLIFLFL